MTSANKISAKKFPAKEIFMHFGLSPLLLASMMLASMTLAGISTNAGGAVTDLATAPMVNGPSFQIKPNVFLMMDDSGSMAWDYMPDNKNTVFFPIGTYGYVSNQCNGVYYNPQITYIPPVQSSGVSYGNSSFTAAPVDGFGQSSTAKVNLSTNFQPGQFTGSGVLGGGGPAYYYTYTGSNTSTQQKTYFVAATSFFKECNTSLTAGNVADVTVNLKPTDAGQVNQILVSSGTGGSATTPPFAVNAIMAQPTDVEANSYLLAQDIANQINACTTTLTGACTVTGFSANVSAIVTPSTSSAGTVVISAPDGSYAGTLSAVTGTPSLPTPNPNNTSQNQIGVTYSGAVSSAIPITFAKNSTATVSGITVNGVQLMGQTTGAMQSVANLAGAIVDNINDCTDPATMAAAVVAGSWSIANCPAGGSGYSAVLTYSSGTTVNGLVIYSPTSTTATPAASLSVSAGTVTVTPAAFAAAANSGSSSISATAFNGPAGVGLFHQVTVSATSGPGGTDERTNFANWYSYYRTRILMMKSASGIAFNNLSANYRVGFGTMNNNGNNMFVNIGDFNSTQKTNFLNKLYSASPGNSTPLLQALSYAGLLYADKMPGNTFNNVAVVDPMQYSCQQNYTLLTTDGFWNNQNNLILDTTSGNVISGTTAVGNQDGTEPPSSKQNDGAILGWKQQTGPLQWTTDIKQTSAPLQWSTDFQKTTATLQWATNLQSTSAPLMKSTYGTTYNASYYTLQVRNKTSSSWATASANTSYVCIYTGTGSGSNKYCQTTGSATVVTGLATCNPTYFPAVNPSTGTASTNGSSQVITTCTPVTGWSTAAAVGPNGTCSTSGTVACSLGTATTAYIGTYPPTCTPSGTYNAGGASTANGSGNVVTCSAAGSYSTPVTVASGGSCNGGLANVKCSTTGATTAYLTAYPPSCTGVTLFNAGGPNTASGTSIATACAATGTFNPTWTNAGSGGSCTAGTDVKCNAGAGTSTYVTTYPPSGCTVNFTAGGSSTADSSGKVISACTATGTFNSTWTNIASGGSCTAGTDVNCQYNWNAGVVITGSCSSSFSSGAGAWNITSGTNCIPYATGGTSNTLADVAEFYYINDLRTPAMGNCASGSGTGQTLCSTAVPDPYNNVPKAGTDTATWQHMTTFTMGLGERGYMNYAANYQAAGSSPDYDAINSLAANLPPAWVASHTYKVGDTYLINGVTGYQVTTQYTSGTSFGATDLNNSSQIAIVCSWQTGGSGICHWPTPNPSGGPENIDDLWHAAVDGRGTYYSATDPTTLASGLTNALASVVARTGTDAAASTSSANPVPGDNYDFSSVFTTLSWNGDVTRQQLDLTTGQPIQTIDPVTGQFVNVYDWDAQALLDAEPWANRTVYTFDQTNANGNNLRLFTWNNLTPTEQGYFTSPAISALSQLCTSGTTCLPVWTAGTAYVAGNEYRVGTTWYHVNSAYTAGASFGATDLANTSVITGASGSNLVNFLYGDRSNEEGSFNDTTKYFRHRADVLGDIVDSEVVYIKHSKFTYADPGYASFAGGNLNRQGMVYVGANDGMLHAFYSESGTMDPATGDLVSSGSVATNGGSEAWAYIPSVLMPQLFHLADKNYANNHQYYVDGTPTQGEVCVSGCSSAATAVWKSILVGGLNGGGRTYYALDVTNPAKPVALWEFTDTNMGYTYGNPVITKLADGSWVVLLTSGYNNVNTGDGIGRLYVLDAYTGTLHTAVNGTGIISTGVGSTATPSGLARITAEVVDPASDNSVLQVYGGDLLGNLWRFDVNNSLGAGYAAQLLATLAGPTGTPQPITAKPEVGLIGTSTMVFIGTGRYLGTSDILAADQVSPNVQTMYGIYDPLSTGTTPSVAIYPSPRSNTLPANPSSSNTNGTTDYFVQQTLTLTSCPAGAPVSLCSVGQNVFTTTNNAVNVPSLTLTDGTVVNNTGWYVDLPLSGQRAYTDPTLQLGTLAFTSNIPSGSACTVGGSSYSHYLNYKTGGPVSTAAVTTTNIFGVTSTVYVSGFFLGNALATRPVFVELPSGAVVALIRLGTGGTDVGNVPIGTGSGTTRRVSWRELLSK